MPKKCNRFLPRVPGRLIKKRYAKAPGNEIATGKFDSPESSAALVANAFGFFLKRPGDLPPLPGCKDAGWPESSLCIEKGVRFPWKGGRHPWLDVLITTPSTIIGIESKRFEPFRSGKHPGCFSEVFWKCRERRWGAHMKGYEGVRDEIRDDPHTDTRLDAAQLVKHALALRTRVGAGKQYEGRKPVLFYLYAEPDSWPKDGKPIDDEAKAVHREEICSFAKSVATDEVRFVARSYGDLLVKWAQSKDPDIRDHARAVTCCFSP